MRLIHVFPAHLLNTVNKLTLNAINRTETRKCRLAGKNKTGFSDGRSTVCHDTKPSKGRRELPDKKGTVSALW
jgi:hypothetical protein